MVDIPTFFPVPPSRPGDAPQQRPEGRQQQQDRLNQAQATTAEAQRQKSNKAPLNVIPNDSALERLVARAQEAQTEGTTLERGTILNLVI